MISIPFEHSLHPLVAFIPGWLTRWVPTWLSAWLTPVWILGIGALLGLLVLLVLWGLLLLVSRRAANGVPLAVREGVLLPILAITVALALFGLVGTVVVQQPREMMQSLLRLPFAGTNSQAFSIPAAPSEQPTAIDFEFRRDELRRLVLSSSEPLLVTTRPQEPEEIGAAFEVTGGEETVWAKGEESTSPFKDQVVRRLYVENLGDAATTLRVTAVTAPKHPEVATIPVTALAVIAVFLLYLAQAAFVPKLSAIALSTAKSEMAQPLFLINMTLGTFLLILFLFIPYNTFGEDIKMLKDSGLTLIMVLCIIQAVWAASTSISDEIEGRTALTVLSKPIGRRQFIFGKFLGIIWAVSFMFIVLGLILLITVAYKPVYDARETANVEPAWSVCHLEMILTVPGLVLAFLETVVMTALSVAISTRLPMLANFIICFSVYVLGHLTPLIVQSSVAVDAFEPVVFVGTLIATIFPVLDHFNIQAAVAAGVTVPYDYLAWALLYCVIYSTIAMLLALALFEDRDLA